MNGLKSIGSALLGLLTIAAVLVLIALLLGGTTWVSERLLPMFSAASLIAFFILIVILLPLSLFRKTRYLAAIAILCLSYLFGATVWMEGLVTTLYFWGGWGVVIGIFLGGLGVVPLGVLAALLHRAWPSFFELLILLAITFGSRIFSHVVVTKCEEADRSAKLIENSDFQIIEGDSLTQDDAI